MNDFINAHSWFEEQYSAKSGARYATFKIALNVLLQRKGSVILETGTMRENDWGAGYSTWLFGDFLSHYGGKLITVDISEENICMCKAWTGMFRQHIEYVASDSLEYLRTYTGQIDLLYLDSFDYPLELLDLYDGKTDPNKAIELLKAKTTEEIIRLHGDLLCPPQEHQLKELQLALPHMRKGDIVLLDDNDWPGGGKTRLSKEHLASIGATCLLDGLQSVWML